MRKPLAAPARIGVAAASELPPPPLPPHLPSVRLPFPLFAPPVAPPWQPACQIHNLISRHCSLAPDKPIAGSSGTMFMQQKRDPAVAKAELRRNVTLFAAACLAVRAVPYVLDFLQSQRA